MVCGDDTICRRRTVISLRFKESGNNFADSFFVVDNEYVFGWHWAYLPDLLYGTAHASKRVIVHL
jgi:hypothetical protein